MNNMREDYADGLKLLLAAAGCVLLVACANIANLLLARGLKNRQQTAIRIALGSGRRRLVRKALLESIVLAVVGGVAGIGVAFAGTRLILHLAFAAPSTQGYIPIHATPSLPVLLFTLGISVLTGVIFGIAPAWMTSHAEPIEALRGTRGVAGDKARWPQKTLVIAQAAMSLVLLSAAAMLGQSLRNLQHQNFGFETKDRYLASINPMLGGYKPEQLQPLFRQMEERLRAIPGVGQVSSALYAPMSGDSWNTSVRMQGRPEPPAKEETGAGWTRVTPGFFETVGNRIVRGRPITEDDTATTRRVAVINEAFAKRFFKGEDPIGRHFGPGETKYSGMFEVVGVNADMRYITYALKEPNRPMFFLPQAQTSPFDEPSEKAGEIWSHYLYNMVLWAPGESAEPGGAST